MTATGHTARQVITVSIVSHGQGALVGQLLRQLNALSSAVIAKVVLTLNLPEPLDVDSLGLRFPLEVLVNAVPQGFGANHNHAFSHCKSAWFLVLNPDIELRDDALARLLTHALSTSGVLAPLVQEPHTLLPTPERNALTPWELLVGKRLLRSAPAAPVWFPGMFMLFRARAYRQVGGFDERFHLYCEDFEVCARLRLRGWALQRDWQVTVCHDARRDSHVRPTYLLWHVQSLLRLWATASFWRYWWFLRRGA